MRQRQGHAIYSRLTTRPSLDSVTGAATCPPTCTFFARDASPNADMRMSRGIRSAACSGAAHGRVGKCSQLRYGRGRADEDTNTRAAR
jgi:hypothetical protein